MPSATTANPAVQRALAQLVAAVDDLTAAVAQEHLGPKVPQSAHRIACDAQALAGLQALELADAALSARRARLLVVAAGPEPEALTAKAARDPERDTRIGDVRAVELAAVLRCTPNRARNLVHEARTLVGGIPLVLAAVESGRATPYQARLAAEAWNDLVHRHDNAASPVTDLLTARFCTRILRRSETQTATEFKRTLATAVAALSPAPDAASVPDPRETRHVSVQPDGNGMAWLTAYLDIVSATRVMQVLDHCARHDHTLAGTMAQRAADALVAIVDGVSDVSPQARTQAAEVQVLVSFAAMQATAEALARGEQPDTRLFGEVVASGHIVEGAALLDLFAQATFRRLVVCDVTGQLLDYGRTTYRPPGPLRDHIRGRDRTCRAPGCIRPAVYTDLDHVQAWDSGGTTNPANLAALCRTHHVLKTHGEWDYTIDPDGSARWRTPAGLALARAAGEYLDHMADDPPPF